MVVVYQHLVRLDCLGERVESERNSHLGVGADYGFAKVEVIDFLELTNGE